MRIPTNQSGFQWNLIDFRVLLPLLSLVFINIILPFFWGIIVPHPVMEKPRAVAKGKPMDCQDEGPSSWIPSSVASAKERRGGVGPQGNLGSSATS